MCKSTKRNFPKVKTLEELLAPSISQHGLEKYAGSLAEGFLNFLSSDNEEDHLHLMNMGYAMFSARLVASDIGVDPLTLSELRDSKLILDTNFLVAVALDNGRLSAAMSALGNALKIINAKLVVLYETRSEYERVIKGVRGEIVGLLRQYPIDIIKDTESDFITTATKLGCRNEEDFQRFFDTLTLPKRIPNGPEITLEDDGEIKATAESAQKNEVLKKEIRRISQYRPVWMRKSETAINHDAALLEVGILIRSREPKSWILSFDKVIQACSPGQSAIGLPLVITADTLIHLLALNDAGPGLKSTDFAPLLAQMILRRCIPPTSTYNQIDLHMLHSLNERVGDLPAEKIKEILKIVTLARIEGKSTDDEKLQHLVNRAFQEKKLELPQELQEEKDRRQAAETNTEEERRGREKAEKEIIDRDTEELQHRALVKFVISCFLHVAFASGVAWIVYQNIKDMDFPDPYQLIGLLSFLYLFLPIPKRWEKFQVEKHSAYENAKKTFYQKNH